MSLEHASGDDAQRHAKWATQAFHAVPPPAVQDWGWPRFVSHAELASRGLVRAGVLHVRATVTVQVRVFFF